MAIGEREIEATAFDRTAGEMVRALATMPLGPLMQELKLVAEEYIAVNFLEGQEASGKALIDLKLPSQREVVLKLQEQNEELLAHWETIMSRALEEAEKHNLEELQKIADRLMQQQKQIQTDQIQRLRAQETAMGGNP